MVIVGKGERGGLRNLHEQTRYILGTVGTDVSPQLRESVKQVLLTLNNIIEILAYLVFRQGPESQEEIEILLEQNLQKTIEVLEQNRLLVKKDLDQIQKLNNENYKTVSVQLDRISQLVIEDKSNKSLLEQIQKMDKKLEDLEEKINKIPTQVENLEQIVQRSEKTLESLDNKLSNNNSTITEKVEETITGLNKLTEIVTKLVTKIDQLEKLVDKKQKYASHTDFKLGELHPCHETGEFPHLFHTDNPQLNNIADMLVHIHSCCCKNRQSSLEDLSDLRSLIDTLKDKQKGQLIIDPLDKLYKLISQLEEKQNPKRCITVQDLERFVRDKEKDNKELVILDLEPGRIKPPFRF